MSAEFQQLVFIPPDHRFFVDTGQPAEETIDFVLRALKEFGNDSQRISEFMNRVCCSDDVAFAFVYGSAVNSNLRISEIEDVDIFIATRSKKFIYDWDRPKGTEIRYLLVSELKNYLKVEKRFFLPAFNKEYNAMGGIFANGLLTIKFSKELENIIQGVRQNFQKIHVKALSQIVENDCKKRMEKRSKYIKSKMHFSSHEKKPFSFYGSEIRLSFDEARSMIDESIKRKNIQPGKAPAIARRILKRIKTRNVLEIRRR